MQNRLTLGNSSVLINFVLSFVLLTTIHGCGNEKQLVFRVVAQAPGQQCAYGGIRIESGLDNNGDLRLDDAEVDATRTEYGCAVLAEGQTSRVRVTPEPVGKYCRNAGYRIQSGLDRNNNQELDSNEVESDVRVCNGVDALNGLVMTTPEPRGMNCTNGGTRVASGLDLNRSTRLDNEEISNVEFVCNGIDAINGIVRTSNEPNGLNCPNGGQRIASGLDNNRNSALDDAEITRTSYVCNGTSSIVRLGTVPSTPNPSSNQCLFGGTRVDSGRDSNGDGRLQDSEVESTSVICSVQVITNVLVESRIINQGEPNTRCTQGGVRMTAGVDMNADRLLQPAEITSSVDVCNDIQLVQGFNSLIRNLPANSSQCAWGGNVYQAGQDRNYNNVLDTNEIQSSVLVCNGANGLNSLVRQTAIARGAMECGGLGGVAYASGLDTNRNNQLEMSEESQRGVICNGLTGAQGPEGLATLARQSSGGMADSVCGRAGGIVIETGPDTDRNNRLDSMEVTQRSVICAPEQGYNTLTRPVAISSGDRNCPNGGVQFQSGLDRNRNNELDMNEVDYISGVCNGLNGLPGTDGQDGTFLELSNLARGSMACPYGGIRITYGVDANRNGSLDTQEIDGHADLCAPAPAMMGGGM